MPDTNPADDAARTGEQLGHVVAGVVILHMRAMQAGDTAGYAAEHHAVRTGVPVPDLVAVPDQFAPVAERYRAAFAEGRAAYHADIPDLPGNQPDDYDDDYRERRD
jgi:hypothetical protein